MSNYQPLEEEKKDKKVNPQGSKINLNAKAFNPDTIPADYDLGLKHQSAQSVGLPVIDKSKQTELCPCCSREVERTQVPACCQLKKLGFLGSGFPLYFDFLQQCVLILLILFATTADYNLFTNYFYGEKCNNQTAQSGDTKTCVQSIATTFSIANKMDRSDLMRINSMLNCVSIFAILICIHLFRKSQKDLALHIESQSLSAQNFTLMIKNFKPANGNQSIEDQIKQKFDKVLNSLKQDQLILNAEQLRSAKLKNSYKPLPRIVSVSLCYDLSGMAKITDDKNTNIKKKQDFLTQQYKNGKNPTDDDLVQQNDGTYKNSDLNAIQSEITKNEQDLIKLQNQFQDGQSVNQIFLGIAFLTLQWEADKRALMNLQQQSFMDKLFGNQAYSVQLDDQIVQIEEAVRPTDVFWKNLHYTDKTRQCRTLVGHVLSCLFIVVCFCIILYFYDAQEHIVHKKNVNQTQVTMISAAVSILVVIINQILNLACVKVTDYEVVDTQTKYDKTLAVRSGVAQFLNTGVISYLISFYVTDNIYGVGGLIENTFSVLVSNAVTSQATELINLSGIIQRIFLWLEQRKGNKSVLTQSQINQLYEKPEVTVATYYSNIIKTMFFTCFYASCLPLGVIISIFGLVFQYWVDKYNLVNRRTVKVQIGQELSEYMITFMEYTLPIYCLGILKFELLFIGSISFFTVLGLIIAFANSFLPITIFTDYIIQLPQRELIEVSYDESEIQFTTDYRRENPAIQQLARAEYVKKQQQIVASQRLQN